MDSINYTVKNFKGLYSNLDVDYHKPTTCPHCNIDTDATIVAKHDFACEFNGHRYIIIIYSCTNCKKIFLALYHIFEEKSETIFVYPKANTSYSNKLISEMSPRFITIYNQALQAESEHAIELAAIGLRSALEILIKDYAVKELKQELSIVSKKSLFDCIGEYLGEKELISSADVVRILANDYVHYSKKHDDIEDKYALLKLYMAIFIHTVENKLMVLHPPLSR